MRLQYTVFCWKRFLEDLLKKSIRLYHKINVPSLATSSSRSLEPCVFIPRMLADPETLLHRSLKMNDERLSDRILAYFQMPHSSQLNVLIAKKFTELRQLLSCLSPATEVESVPQVIDNQLADHVKELSALVAQSCVHDDLPVLSHLTAPLLAFYTLVDLAVSAAPSAELSVRLLRNGSARLEGGSNVLPITDSLSSALQNWISRLLVLVEARTEFKGHASLASIILDIETLPSEPALLKSHLNRLHSQRHAILSLVESVDLMKKGQTSQRSIVDFLSSAIKTLTSEEAAELPRDHAAEDAHFTGPHGEEELSLNFQKASTGSRYLLRFLE